MNYRLITFAIILFILGQGMVWIQVNGPLIWPWAKKYKLLLMLFGIPITYLFMEATRFAVTGFEGMFWPGRFVSFVSGIMIFTLFNLVAFSHYIISRRQKQLMETRGEREREMQ